MTPFNNFENSKMGQHGNFDYKACCFYGTWSGVALTFFTLCVALLAGGTHLYHSRNHENTMPLDMEPSLCALRSSEVIRCDRGTWMATYNDGQVVESPFAARYTQELALLSTLAYPLNASYPCMCRPVSERVLSSKCDSWSAACVLNVNLTYHLQKTGIAYKYGGDILVAIGSIILILIVVSTILLLVARGCCACCRKSNAKEGGVYEIGTDSDEEVHKAS
jgi:hypothetical protein